MPRQSEGYWWSLAVMDGRDHPKSGGLQQNTHNTPSKKSTLAAPTRTDWKMINTIGISISSELHCRSEPFTILEKKQQFGLGKRSFSQLQLPSLRLWSKKNDDAWWCKTPRPACLVKVVHGLEMEFVYLRNLDTRTHTHTYIGIWFIIAHHAPTAPVNERNRDIVTVMLYFLRLPALLSWETNSARPR